VSTKTWKDIVFSIENVLNNINFILRRFGIEVEPKMEGVITAIKRLADLYKSYESSNRGIHRLSDRILDNFSQIVNECLDLVSMIEKLVQSNELAKIVSDFQVFEKRCAKCVRDLSAVDVLSLEIDECKEMQFWRESYNKIREVVYYIVWLTYYLLWLALYMLYKHSPDTSESIRQTMLSRCGAIMLVHRALFK